MESSKRIHLTVHQKAQLRSYLAANPNLPQFAVADWVREHFHVRLGRTTLYRIQSAPEDAFTSGNPSRKKLRRVTFPDFERQLLRFYEARRECKEDVSDNLLMRKAAECRAACGISAQELKLSNGWLYRFKLRHQLTSVPPQTRGLLIDAIVTDGAINRRGEEDQLPEESEREPGSLSLRALTTVQAPGYLNWEPVGEVHSEAFAIVADGILVLQPGKYELSIRVQHTAPLPTTDCIFKVHHGFRLLGQCGAPARIQNNIASSVWTEPSLPCSANSILTVEFLAPGYALTGSSLVLRRVQ